MTQIEFQKYQELVKILPIGKQLPDAVYIHKSAFPHIPEALASLTSQMTKLFEIADKPLAGLHQSALNQTMSARNLQL